MIAPEFGTVGPELIREAAKEAVKIADQLVVCGFAFDPLAGRRSPLSAGCLHRNELPIWFVAEHVEQFMLDYMPRKVAPTLSQIRLLPAVLRGWVRFALARRGLEARWIAETEEAVDRFAKEFRRAMTDQTEFGPAKSLVNAMLADGVDLLDQAAVDRWIEEFNAPT